MRQCITADDIPPQVWYGSAVLRELGRHPHHPPPSHVDVDGLPVDASLDVSILFEYSDSNMMAAEHFVERGEISPASVRTLSRLCLTTVAAMNALGGDGTLHYSFRAVIRRHLEQLGPRTGVWEAVRHTSALVGGGVCKLECKAWSTAPWTPDMAQWLQSVSLDQLCDNEWWWLMKRRDLNRHERIAVLRAAASRGCTHTVKHICSPGASHNAGLDSAGTPRQCLDPPHATPGAVPGVHNNVAMRLAAENGHLQLVQYLCSLPTEHGVDPSANNTLAVRCAAANGHLQVVQYMCSLPMHRGVDPGAHNNAAIRLAAENGHFQVVQYLCSLPTARGVDPSADDNSALLKAAENGHLQVVQYLCSLPTARGVHPTAPSSGAMQMAASYGHLQVVQYLCSLPTDRGVNPGAWQSRAIRVAAQYGHLHVAQYLCSLPTDRGVDPGACGNYAIRRAAKRGHLQCCSVPVLSSKGPWRESRRVAQLGPPLGCHERPFACCSVPVLTSKGTWRESRRVAQLCHALGCRVRLFASYSVPVLTSNRPWCGSWC